MSSTTCHYLQPPLPTYPPVWRMGGQNHLTFGEFVGFLACCPDKVAGVPQVVGDKAAALPVAADEAAAPPVVAYEAVAPPVAADEAAASPVAAEEATAPPNGVRQSCSAPWGGQQSYSIPLSEAGPLLEDLTWTAHIQTQVKKGNSGSHQLS